MKKDYSYWIIPVYKDNNWDYRFLLINQKTFDGDFWWFPKWHAENWEDWLNAAIRELREEVWIENIKIDKENYWDINYNFENKWIKYNKKVRYRLWFVDNKDVIIQEKEVKWYKRAKFNEVLDILTYENMKKLFIEISKNLFVIK